MWALAILPLVGMALAGLVREYLFWSKKEPEIRQGCKKISVVIPMRGVYPWTEDNLKAITRQKVDTEVEYLFVVDSLEDPAGGVVHRFGRVILNEGVGKSAALATALKNVDGDCIVFSDDDIKPNEMWLYLLTSPLSTYDAVTTYRWYLGKGLCHKVRLAISNTGFPAMLDKRSRFVWGGSTAFRKDLVEKTDLASRLLNYISDDYAVYSALKEVGGSIYFARGAVAPTPDPQCRISEALRWGIRQILMVKWHAPAGWYAGLAIYTLGFLISIVFPLVAIFTTWELLLGLFLHPINLVKDLIRARGVRRHVGIPIGHKEVVATWAVGLFAIPLAVWLSIFVKCVDWRGRKICR